MARLIRSESLTKSRVVLPWRRCGTTAIVFAALAMTSGCRTAPEAADEPTASGDAATEQTAVDRRADQYADRIEANMRRSDSEVQWRPTLAGAKGSAADRESPAARPPESIRRTGDATGPAATTAPAEVPAAGESQPAPPAPTVPAGGEKPDGDRPAAATPLSVEQLVKRLAVKLTARLAGQHAGLKAEVERAALAVFDPTLELTQTDLTALPARERATVLAYQRVFTQLGQTLGADGAGDAEQLEIAAEELGEQIAGQREFAIRTLKLGTRVDGYGVYKTFAKNVFLAGRRHPMLVYAELDHFTPKRMDSGEYEVKLTQEIVLYNESDGLAVWRQRPATIIDRSRNRRRDFFTVQEVRLPDRLTVGKYLLKISITDEYGGAIDEASVPLEIVADRALTGGRN